MSAHAVTDDVATDTARQISDQLLPGASRLWCEQRKSAYLEGLYGKR